MEVYRLLLDKFGYQDWWPVHPGQDRVIEISVGAVLTQNTSWKNVEKALENLIRNQAISFQKILELPLEDLQNLIRPAGFFQRKAVVLKELAELFLTEEEIDREKLLSIKGIGKETADSILLYALDKPYFVIDSYTKRLFSRLVFCEESISYDDLQQIMKKNLPEDLQVYKEFHALIVQQCKEYCRKRPVCKVCPLKSYCTFPKNTE